MDNLQFEQVPILAYHNVGFPSELGGTTVLPRTFERQIRHLTSEGYQSLHPDQLVRSLDAPHSLPARSVLITFDDAYTGVHEHAQPILAANGFTATVFVIAGYPGQTNHWDLSLGWRRPRHLDWSQLRELADAGWCIGAHGLSHRFLTHTHNPIAELRASRDLLQSHLQMPVDYLAYPYGAWNSAVATQVAEVGYRAAFGYDPYLSFAHRYALPRIGVYLIDGLRSFQAKLGQRGSRAFRWECLKHRCIHRVTYLNLLRPKYWRHTRVSRIGLA